MNSEARCWLVACVVASVIPAVHSAEPGDGAASMTIEEVVVTARKRAESMQDVPISITALSGEAIDKAAVVDMNDVDRMATNVVFEGLDRTKPLVYVRGIGTRTYDPGSDPSVGVFVDGVYLGRFGGHDMDLNDIERVEVLKGPQGTLYGRNTIGGALSVVTRDPTDYVEGNISAEYGLSEISGDNLWSIAGRVAGPIGDSGLLGSLSAKHRNRDGYIRVVDTDERGANEDSTALRGKLLIPVGESAQIKLAADYSTHDGPTLIFTRDDLDGRSPSPLPFIPAPPQPTDLYRPTSDRTDVYTDKDILGISATVDWTLGDVELISITAYRELDWQATDDLDASELDVSFLSEDETSDQFSQELRLNWATENTNLLLGLFYGTEDVQRVDSIHFGLHGLGLLVAPLPLVWDFGVALDATSYAAFGQFEWNITDRLALNLGGRYSYDEKDYWFNTVTLGILLPPFTLDLSEDWDSFDPSVSLEYHATDDVMLYASWTSGYKSGAFQFAASSPFGASKVADPEQVDAIEVGIKSQLLDRRLQLNAAVFDMDYKDLQLLSLSPIGIGNVALLLIDNAADSTIRGFELETKAILSDSWSIELSYAYLDAEFDEYIRDVQQGIDFSGNKLARSPENTFQFALNYSRVHGFGQVDGRIGYVWRDEYFFEPDNDIIDPNSKQDSEGLLDASLNIDFGDWSILLYGRNLTDERYRRSVLNQEATPQRTAGIEPRTMGIRVSRAFGAGRN